MKNRLITHSYTTQLTHSKYQQHDKQPSTMPSASVCQVTKPGIFRHTVPGPLFGASWRELILQWAKAALRSSTLSQKFGDRSSLTATGSPSYSVFLMTLSLPHQYPHLFNWTNYIHYQEHGYQLSLITCVFCFRHCCGSHNKVCLECLVHHLSALLLKKKKQSMMCMITPQGQYCSCQWSKR